MNKVKLSQNSKVYFILLLLLSIVIIGESVFIVNTVSQKRGKLPSPLIKNVTLEEESVRASMGIILKDSQKVIVGRNLNGQLVFNSPNELIAGVDAVLSFNPQLVAISEITGNKELFEQIIVNRQQEKQGRIKLTAYLPKKPIRGEQTLALITFRLLENQPVSLELEFLGPDRVTDSNLVSQTTQKDLLNQVQSLKLVPEGR